MIAMYLPKFDIENKSNNQNLEGKTDDAVQDIYSSAKDAIKEHLGVEIESPTRSDVVFRLEGCTVDLQYAHTGEERFRIVDNDAGMPNKYSEEEFVEKVREVDEDILWRLKKAIGIYKQIVSAQQKFVHESTLEARYT